MPFIVVVSASRQTPFLDPGTGTEVSDEESERGEGQLYTNTRGTRR